MWGSSSLPAMTWQRCVWGVGVGVCSNSVPTSDDLAEVCRGVGGEGVLQLSLPVTTWQRCLCVCWGGGPGKGAHVWEFGGGEGRSGVSCTCCSLLAIAWQRWCVWGGRSGVSCTCYSLLAIAWQRWWWCVCGGGAKWGLMHLLQPASNCLAEVVCVWGAKWGLMHLLQPASNCLAEVVWGGDGLPLRFWL